MLKNSLINLVGSGLNIVIGIISIPLLIRFLGLEGYGMWTLIVSIIGFVNLAEAGLSTASVVFISRSLNEGNDEVRNTSVSAILSIIVTYLFSIGLLVSAFVYFLAPKLVIKYVDIPEGMEESILSAFQIGAIYIILRLLTQIFLGLEQAYKRYDIINLLNSTQILLLNVGLIVLAFYGATIDVLVIWWTFLGGAYFIIHFLFTRKLLKGIHLKYFFDFSKAKEIFSYSSFVWGSTIAQTLFSQTDRLVVGGMLGPEKLGIYSAITGIAKKINVFSSVVVQPLLPEISEVDVESGGSFDQVKKKVELGLKLNVFLAFTGGGLILVFAEELLRVILDFNPDTELVYTFIVLVTIYTLYSLNAVGYFVLLSLKKSETVMKNLFLSVFIFLSLLFTGTYYLGFLGAVIANLGYVCTLFLLVIGMEALDIPFKKWSKWFVVPFIWFVLTLLAACLVVSFDLGFASRIAIVFVLSPIILFWFLKNGLGDRIFKFLAEKKIIRNGK